MRPYLLMAALAALACGGAKARTSSMLTPAAPWTLSYSDGAANRYLFAQEAPGEPVRFAYEPVTPEESSTGHYSGGDPASATLASGDPRVEELWRSVDALERDTAAHADARRKGTGQVHVSTPAGERSFILEMGAAQADFEGFIKQWRSR